MSARRDMTRAQYAAALKRHGMAPAFLGYVTIWRDPNGGGSAMIYPGNAGPNRRARLAYLLREQARRVAEYEAAQRAKDGAP